MKLYFSPGACSMVPHIILEELNLPYTAVQASTKDKTYEGGGDLWKINPKGQVPILELDNGEILTENAVILQYLASLKPESGFLAPSGMERFRQLEALNFCTTDLHKGFTPLFNPSMPDEAKAIFKDILRKKYEFVNEQLKQKPYFAGKTFGLADAYLFVVTRWAKAMHVDLNGLDLLAKHFEETRTRPTVDKVMKAEMSKK